MRGIDYALLLLLAALWGLSFAFYRIGAPALGPALFVELRVSIAALALVAYTAARGMLRDNLREIWRKGRLFLVIGAVNAAIPFTLFAIAELRLPASYASVLNATTPLFAVLLGAVWIGQRVTARRILGVSLGIAGVGVLVGAAPFALSLPVLISVGLAVVAALTYAFAAIFIRRRMSDARPLELSLGQTIAAAALLTPFAAYNLPHAEFTEAALVAAVGIALLSTALAYLIYFRILQSAGSTQALTVTFLMPIFGVIWGGLLLGEPIGPGVVAGSAIVLLSVALVTDLGMTPTRPRDRESPEAGP